ncbi:hypothetical protein SSS_08699 [Sarcoptes scabiei]|nr:hypothetical protein SSS_08699 [Sarcoptes scabiei]
MAPVISLSLLSTFSPCLLLFCFSFQFLVQGLYAVRVVALNVPNHVDNGTEVELSCLYDLDNASLYSLKWFYRINDTDLDEQEFFRYTPTIKPHKQFFPLDGIEVNINKSEGGRVFLTATDKKTTGNYKCEISVDGTFQTVAAEKLMIVLTNDSSERIDRIFLIFSVQCIFLCAMAMFLARSRLDITS